jgi:anti-sigma-K factor RsiG
LSRPRLEQVSGTQVSRETERQPVSEQRDDLARAEKRRVQAEARTARAAARAAARAIPPQRASELAHLSLDGLRAYRTALAAEEDRVSYWRRIIQARLDTVRLVEGVRAVDASSLKPVLSSARIGRGRSALVRVVPIDDIPPLPDLERLWEAVHDATTPVERTELERDLERAEHDLSEYRNALHKRMATASEELIARYRDHPLDCLTALPL